MRNTSRHPKINYWFWDEKTITDKQYLKDIDILAENSSFDLVFLTERGNLNFWEPSIKPYMKEMVEYAHSKGIKVGLQLWPQGMMHEPLTDVITPVALVTEYEGSFENGKLVINAHGQHVRNINASIPLSSELLFVGTFKKTGTGFYDESTYKNITHLAKTKTSDDPQALEVVVEADYPDGYNAYVMVAHYYKFGDLFGENFIFDYKNIIDFYSDIPFDGFGLDEFKNMQVGPHWEITEFRERMFGRAFEKYFEEQTGDNLIDTMFHMRFCPDNRDDIRMSAINKYFDILRHSTIRIENFVADYALKVFGENTFIGLHNTFHNSLQNDELWATGCNWWEIPRKYAQTDEDICYPVRMGMACGCPENLVYDMYYNKDESRFYEKAVRDARFNTRIHYHAINDGSVWGTNTGTAEFLQTIEKIESKITLLNKFDPVLPKMELLVVFGFPAIPNWYPDEEARNVMDVNGKLNILGRVKDIWERGYLNALAPSDALADGRITVDGTGFDYCGHRFEKMLYLYPEYSKPEVADFIENAVSSGCEIKIIGNYTRGFDGQPAGFSFADKYTISEDADVAAEMKLTPNTIENGCILEDGSVVISDFDSVMNDTFCTCTFETGCHKYEASFCGTFAVKTDENGDPVKLAAGNFRYLKKDGKEILTGNGEDIYNE